MLARQKEEEELKAVRQANYEKNYKRAEQQAQAMLQSAQKDAKITAQSELSEMFGLQNNFGEPARVIADAEPVQHGFIGSFVEK